MRKSLINYYFVSDFEQFLATYYQIVLCGLEVKVKLGGKWKQNLPELSVIKGRYESFFTKYF